MDSDLVEFVRTRPSMLRDLGLDVEAGAHALGERAHELLHVAIAAHGAESAAGLVQRGADPAQHHLPKKAEKGDAHLFK